MVGDCKLSGQILYRIGDPVTVQVFRRYGVFAFPHEFDAEKSLLPDAEIPDGSGQQSAFFISFAPCGAGSENNEGQYDPRDLPDIQLAFHGRFRLIQF
jgi:hypothetical protein